MVGLRPKRIVILASGRGTNFVAIADAIRSRKIPRAELIALITNKKDAPVEELARSRGITTFLIDSDSFRTKGQFDRASFEEELHRRLQTLEPDLICLAGYMLLLGSRIVQSYPNQIINIHPSLLPHFKGLNAQRQALISGAQETGCTVHFVNELLDDGPIILQKKIPILKNETEDSLSARLLPIEHEAYVEALKQLCSA